MLHDLGWRMGSCYRAQPLKIKKDRVWPKGHTSLPGVFMVCSTVVFVHRSWFVPLWYLCTVHGLFSLFQIHGLFMVCSHCSRFMVCSWFVLIVPDSCFVPVLFHFEMFHVKQFTVCSRFVLLRHVSRETVHGLFTFCSKSDCFT